MKDRTVAIPPGLIPRPNTADTTGQLSRTGRGFYKSPSEIEKDVPWRPRPHPGKALIDPINHALILIDFQSQMAFATKSIDAVTLRNNAALISHAAAGFKVPTILTTVAEKSFSGPMFSEITDAFPGQKLFDRTSMNTWEDAAVIDEVNRIGKDRIVLAGLWTGVCIVGPALSGAASGLRGLCHLRRLR